MRTNFWNKGSIFASFIGCCVIMALLCSSLATNYWVTSDAVDSNPNTTNTATINLGLFSGSKVKSGGTGARKYDLKVTCDKGEGACMYSCGRTYDDRQDDLHDLLSGNSTWDEGSKCDSSTVTGTLRSRQPRPLDGPLAALLRLTAVRGSDLQGPQQQLAVVESFQAVTTLKQTEPEFMLFGLWVATIAMMAAAILFVLVAAMFAILNTATNPVETITGVVGLYVWNGIAMFFELLVLILWGIQFHKKLSHSVLWREELVQQWSSDGLASLGYSYWLVFVAFILHVVNMAILWFGTHQKRPKKVQIPVERGNTNAVNMIY